MNRTLSSDVGDALHEIRDSELTGELHGPALIIVAGKDIGIFIVGDW